MHDLVVMVVSRWAVTRPHYSTTSILDPCSNTRQSPAPSTPNVTGIGSLQISGFNVENVFVSYLTVLR